MGMLSDGGESEKLNKTEQQKKWILLDNILA